MGIQTRAGPAADIHGLGVLDGADVSMGGRSRGWDAGGAGPASVDRGDVSDDEEIIEWVDRYGCFSLVDPETVCKGDCEGMGVVPVYRNFGGEGWASEKDPAYRALWDEAEANNPTEDGWHFVPCIDCHGKGETI